MTERLTTVIAERYVKAMIQNINERFLQNNLSVLEAFSIFDLGSVPTDCSSYEFTVYRNIAVETLCEFCFGTHDEREIILLLSGTDSNLG